MEPAELDVHEKAGDTLDVVEIRFVELVDLPCVLLEKIAAYAGERQPGRALHANLQLTLRSLACTSAQWRRLANADNGHIHVLPIRTTTSTCGTPDT